MSGPLPDMLLAGRYRLAALIGRGGMGEVWRATDELLHRAVAIKTLAAGMTSKRDMGERFRREALAVARLSHRRVAGVFDYVEEGGVAFLVMELLDGETLAERLDRPPAPTAGEAVEIVGQAAEGLQAAHDAGITHRDVKPANIMLTAHGVKLLDFGLASTTWDAGLTSTGILIGTLSYIAPERVAGGPGTPASDIYALGVVLYEMLAGHPPFRADNPLALVRAHAAEVPPPLPATTPPALAAACLAALAKDPAGRPPTAAAFAAAIRGQATGGWTPGRPAGTGATTVRRRHGRPATMHLPAADLAEYPAAGRRAPRTRNRAVPLALVAVVALLVAVILAWPGGRDRASGGSAPSTSRTQPPAAATATTTSPARPAPPAPPKPPTAAAAIAALLKDIAGGVASGGIRPDLAKDLTKSVKELRTQLAKGRTKDAARRLGDLGRKLRAGTRDEKISPQAAATLQADVRDLATALKVAP